MTGLLVTVTFIFNYSIIELALAISIGWEVVKRTTFPQSDRIDPTSALELFDTSTDQHRRERQAAPDSMKAKTLTICSEEVKLGGVQGWHEIHRKRFETSTYPVVI